MTSESSFSNTFWESYEEKNEEGTAEEGTAEESAAEEGAAEVHVPIILRNLVTIDGEVWGAPVEIEQLSSSVESDLSHDSDNDLEAIERIFEDDNNNSERSGSDDDDGEYGDSSLRARNQGLAAMARRGDHASKEHAGGASPGKDGSRTLFRQMSRSMSALFGTRLARQPSLRTRHKQSTVILSDIQLLRTKSITKEHHLQEFLRAFANSHDDCNIIMNLHETSITNIISRIVDTLVKIGAIGESEIKNAKNALMGYRRKVAETGDFNLSWHLTIQGHAFIIPLGRLATLKERHVVFVRLAQPTNLGALDESMTEYVVAILGPKHDIAATKSLVESGKAFASVLSDPDFHADVKHAKHPSDIQRGVREFLHQCSVKADQAREHKKKKAGPHIGVNLGGEEEPDVPVHEENRYLYRTGVFAGGLRADIARRAKHYKSDWKDGIPDAIGTFVSTIVFLFFACLAPAVAFGALADHETHHEIGVVEMLVGQALCGLVFPIIGGQPLMVMRTPGPVVIYLSILYTWAHAMHIPFLAFYGWTGLWLSVFLLIISVLDLCCLVRFVGRFTEEIFAALISVIFVYEGIKHIIHSFAVDERSVFLLTLVLVLGMYFLASAMLQFRRSPYLSPTIRVLLADFGPAIAIIAMTGFSLLLKDVPVHRLEVSKGMMTTTNGRPWLVDFGAASVGQIFLAIIPAFLLSILFFLEQNITGLLVNKPDNKLKKGPAYHLDMFVVALQVAACSIIGVPWCLGALPHSPMHARALADIEEYESNGRVAERVVFARETRWTGLLTHVFIAISILGKDILTVVPIPVLYGFFIYMGVTSLGGNHLYDRCLLLFTQPAKYPPNHYVRRLPLLNLHKFTAVQVFCFVFLWLVKADFYRPKGSAFSFAILFPLVVPFYPVVRSKVLPLLFDAETLDTLCGHDVEEEAFGENNEMIM